MCSSVGFSDDVEIINFVIKLWTREAEDEGDGGKNGDIDPELPLSYGIIP